VYSDKLADLENNIFGVENALKAQTAAALMGRDGLTALIALASATAEEFDALVNAVTQPMELQYPEPDYPEPDVPEPQYPEPAFPDYGPQMRMFLSSLIAEIEDARAPVRDAVEALSADLTVTPTVGSMEVDNEALSSALAGMDDSVFRTESVLNSLKTLLTSMTTPTEETAAALSNLGIRMENLHSPGEALEAIRTAFGMAGVSSEALRAELSELNSQLNSGSITQQEYSSGLTALAEKAFGVEGALKAQAAAMLAGEKGLEGLLALVTASAEDFDALADAMDRAGSMDFSTQEAAQRQPGQAAQVTTAQVLPEMQDFIGMISKAIETSRSLLEGAMQNSSVDLVLSPRVQTDTAEGTQTSHNSEMTATLVSMLAEYLPYLPRLANLRVVTDTGALVGELAPKMDERLGLLVTRQRRQ
jgi:hypothetical protein